MLTPSFKVSGLVSLPANILPRIGLSKPVTAGPNTGRTKYKKGYGCLAISFFADLPGRSEYSSANQEFYSPIKAHGEKIYYEQ